MGKTAKNKQNYLPQSTQDLLIEVHRHTIGIWQRIEMLVTTVVSLHRETVIREFANDPTGDIDNWDIQTQYDLLLCSPEETTLEVVTRLYYKAAAREELNRRPLIAEVRKTVAKEAKKKTHKELLWEGHFNKGDYLEPAEIKSIADANNYSQEKMLSNYNKWSRDFQILLMKKQK